MLVAKNGGKGGRCWVKARKTPPEKKVEKGKKGNRRQKGGELDWGGYLVKTTNKGNGETTGEVSKKNDITDPPKSHTG